MESKISIIVTAYNCEKYIERSIKSICEQTYLDIEVILVNDGSTDNTRKIFEQMCLKDDRIKLFNIQNSGVSNAKNYGLECATGSYIMFVDADDYIEKEMCAELLREMNENDTDIVVSKMIDEDIHGNILRKSNVDESRMVYYDKDFRFISDYACTVCCGCLFKRTILNGVRFDSRLYVGEDTLFFYTVLNKCKKYFVTNKLFYHYVNYPESAAHGKLNDKRYTEILAWEEIKKIIPENNGKQYISLCQNIEYMARSKYRKSYNSQLSKRNTEELLRIINENGKVCKKYLTKKGKIERILIRLLGRNYPYIVHLVVRGNY